MAKFIDQQALDVQRRMDQREAKAGPETLIPEELTREQIRKLTKRGTAHIVFEHEQKKHAVGGRFRPRKEWAVKGTNGLRHGREVQIIETEEERIKRVRIERIEAAKLNHLHSVRLTNLLNANRLRSARAVASRLLKAKDKADQWRIITLSTIRLKKGQVVQS